MLTSVQVLPGPRSVARLGAVVVWFETGPQGGGAVLTELLQEAQRVGSGSVPSHELGARLAGVLNAGSPEDVPALAAATPEDDGLRVVVHGWGAVVADGIVHVPNGWADQVITGSRSFFLGRNTVTPVPPAEGSVFDLEDGVVPGDGASFTLSSPQAASPALPPAAADPAAPPPAAPPAPWPAAPAPIAWPPPLAAMRGRDRPHPAPWAPRPTSTAPRAVGPVGSSPAGRLVLDDGSSAVLERTCVLGSAPGASPAVQTGVAIPLTVVGPGVAGVHAELRVDQAEVAVRDLGAALTHVLPPGALTWIALAPGQVVPLEPGTRIALGRRTFSYERP